MSIGAGLDYPHHRLAAGHGRRCPHAGPKNSVSRARSSSRLPKRWRFKTSTSRCRCVQKLSIPILGVVENMSHFIDSAGVRHELFGSGGGEKIAEFAEAPLFGQVPIDAQVREWGDQGTPIVQAAPGSPAGQALVGVADALTEQIAKEHFDRAGGKTAPEGEGPKRLRILR